MPRSLVIIGAACLVELSGCDEAETGPDIRALLDEYARAVSGDLDVELAAQVWSQSEPISMIHPRGHQVGWPDIREKFYVETMGPLSNRVLTLRNVAVHELRDGAAWVEFYWDFEATLPDGTPLRTSGRESQVWANEKAGWRLVHAHYSGAPTQEQGQGF